MIRQAQPSDWEDIQAIYAAARAFMRQAGNPDQWGDTFPPEELIREDLRLGRSYVCELDGRVQGVFAFIPGEDPTYRVIDGAWLDDRPYAAVHRVASRGEVPGVAGQILDWCLEQCGSIRIDTHEKNRPMRRVLEKAGFSVCGQIICDDGTPRIAFQKLFHKELLNMDAIEQKILSILDSRADELQALAQDLYAHAEQGYHEYRTAQVVSDCLKKLGLETREGLAITGLRASVGKADGPNVALIGELDGLACPTHPMATDKGFAHSCGHYAQIVCMLGAAMALTDPEVAASLDGTATFFAVPAEEFQGSDLQQEVRRTHDVHCAGGKCELLRRGEFDDIDMSITTHSLMVARDTDVDLMLGNSACTGFVGKTVYIHGRAAHAAAAPHLGINALNAASLGMSALGMIRETFREKDCVRVHPYIRQGGEAVNVVPNEVIVDMMVRANNQEAIESISAKVDNCFKGAATAIGCTVDIVNAQGYMPCPERLPEDILWDCAKLLGGGLKVQSIPAGACNTASTDVGDLFAVMPVLNFTFGGSTGDLHSKDYAVTDPNVAHVVPAKMMALLAYRLLKNGAAEAKKIIDGYQAPYTLEEYKAYTEKMSG